MKMRLINANKYCDFLNNYPLKKAQDNVMNFYRDALRYTFECEVDAEPVKHGQWIYKGAIGRFPVCECSVCGNAENADWAVLGDNVNYCPNCGAKMDEKRENA